MSPRVKEKTALLMCGEIGRSFYAGEAPPALPELANKLELPALIVGDVAETLVKAGILAATGKGSRHYIPGCPFDTVSADEMLKRIRAVDEADSIGFEQMKSSDVIEHVLKSADALSHRELGKVTLKQVASGSLKE
jgi:hypothetical protein